MAKIGQGILPDRIFGGLGQPDYTAGWMINRLMGVHHYGQKTPAIPKPNERVQLTVTVSADQPVESITAWVSTDEWQTQEKLPFTKHTLSWHSILWTYVQEWRLSLPPQPEGTMLRYKIGARQSGLADYFFPESHSDSFNKATHYSIYYGADGLSEWAKDAIVYQIFIDRFYPGQGKAWQLSQNLKNPFGGTLRGVIEKLGYIQSMGFNAIWLTPIFESPSQHGYDITDFYKINSRLGSMADFNELIAKAHRLGIKVIFDFVANHCSRNHPYFIDALKTQSSAFHDWFVWKTWPDYECFYDVRNLPKINLRYGSPAREYLLDCAQYWLKLGVDGYRLDHAHGPEMDFWVDFRRVCAETNPDVWTFGEITQPADVLMNYGGGLNGTLDFLLCQKLRETFGTRSINLSEFGAFVENHFEYYPEEFSLPSFIDNHDMNRFAFLAQDDQRYLKLALFVLGMLPGAPIIYYGTEIALSQNQSIHASGAQGFDESRLPMNWEESESSDLPAYFNQLWEIRRRYPCIHQKPWKVIGCDDRQDVLVLGKPEDESAFLIINRSEHEIQTSIPLKQSGVYLDLMTEKPCSSTNQELQVALPPVSGIVIFRAE